MLSERASDQLSYVFPSMNLTFSSEDRDSLLDILVTSLCLMRTDTLSHPSPIHHQSPRYSRRAHTRYRPTLSHAHTHGYVILTTLFLEFFEPNTHRPFEVTRICFLSSPIGGASTSYFKNFCPRPRFRFMSTLVLCWLTLERRGKRKVHSFSES